MRRLLSLSVLVAANLSALACRAEPPQTDETSQTADSIAGGMAGMPMMGNDSISANMKHQMTMMQGVSADSMKAMLPAHRQMGANMLAQMDQQMTSMNLSADGTWKAMSDSIREDLVRMPNLSGAELQAFMMAHHRRMTQLMAMHESMMKNMRM